MKKKGKGEFWQGFKVAWEGLKIGFRNELNFRIQLLIGFLVVLGGLFCSCSLMKWTLLILMIGLVLGAELFNSAIEYLVDLASPEYHPLAKQAKDVAAAAVLLLSLVAVIVGLLIFLPCF